MDELDRRLSAAPREAEPQRDLWPDIDRRIQTRRPRYWQMAAAVIVIFGAGFLAGRSMKNDDHQTAQTAAPAGALRTAAEVQSTGSAHLAALAKLSRLGTNDELARAQGYEAALTVVATTAEELASAMELPASQSALLTAARAVRDDASRRVIRLAERSEP